MSGALRPRDAVIVGYVRSPFGRHAGALARLRPDGLAGQVLSARVERICTLTPFVTLAPPTCSKVGPICVPSRRCSVTPAWPRPSGILTSHSSS